MTIREAIKEIKDVSDSEVRYGDIDHHYDEVMKRIEACDIAIKALEQQPSDDCVSRKAVNMLSIDLVYVTGDKADFLCKFWTGLDALPSVTPKYTDEEIDKAQAVEQAYVDKMVELAVKETERPKGKWIPLNYKDEMWGYVYKCSNCGATEYKDNFCPNCGAKMESEEV